MKKQNSKSNKEDKVVLLADLDLLFVLRGLVEGCAADQKYGPPCHWKLTGKQSIFGPSTNESLGVDAVPLKDS